MCRDAKADGQLAAEASAMASSAPKTIWLWWHSGEATLTPFLRACLESWRVQHPGWRVVLLDMASVWDYLDPEDLPSTFESITRRSLQSDLVRLAVLAKHGGCYADLSCLALTDIAESAWQVLKRDGLTLVGYRAPHFISDFVSAWFLVAEACDPIIVEWSRCFNTVMEGRTDDAGVHQHPLFRGLDLREYHSHKKLDAGFNSATWADYLVVNVALKAVLDRDPAVRARFWRTSLLMAEGDRSASPTTWSQMTAAPKGLVFPESERWKMRRLLEEDAGMVAALQGLPMLKFFNSGSAFAALTREELMASPSVIGRLFQKALERVHSAAAVFERSAADHRLTATSAASLAKGRRPALLAEVHASSAEMQPVQPRHAAVATLVTDASYAAGAACLARSLRSRGGLRPGTAMVCLVPQAACRTAEDARWVAELRAEGWEIVPVEDLRPEDYPALFEGLENPSYQHCFKKLHLWDLARRLGRRMDRVLYVDSDAVVVGDLQAALYSPELEPPRSGVAMSPDYDWRAGRAARASQGETGRHTADAAAAAAFKPGSYCNAGVLLLRPSAAVHRELMSQLSGYRSRGLAEQDLLHDVFTAAGRTRVLDQGYNAQKWIRICAPDMWSSYDLKVIHYNNAKPWSLQAAAAGAVEPCFAAENDECADLVCLWHELFAEGRRPKPSPIAMSIAESQRLACDAGAAAAVTVAAMTAAAAAASGAAVVAAAQRRCAPAGPHEEELARSLSVASAVSV